MPDPERVSEAERQVREAEERLARQLVLIRRLKIAGCDDDADEIAYQRGVPGAAARRQHPVHYHEAVMSRVDLRIDAAELAGTFGHMRSWLDHHDCVPVMFDPIGN